MSTTSYDSKGVTDTTSLNIWHVQKACRRSRQKHAQNLRSREVSGSPPEHKSFRDLNSTEQPEGKTAPVLHSGLTNELLKAASPFGQHKPPHIPP